MTNQEYKNLNMVCLYIFTHNITGLKYFGKTSVNFTIETLLKYGGSGVYWNLHLKEYGKNLSVEIYGIYKISEVKEIALKFSEDNNIVKSSLWANGVPEDGLFGVPKDTVTARNINTGVVSWVSKQEFLSNNILVGISTGHKNPGNNRGMVGIKDERGMVTQVTKEVFDNNDTLFGHQKDTVTVIEMSTGKNLRITKETFYNNKNLYQGVQKGKKVNMTLRNKLSKKYNIMRNSKIIKSNIMALDIRKIHSALEKTSKEKPLGFTKQSKVMLNKYNNLLLIGLYVELIK